MIEVRGLNKSFKHILALRDVDLLVHPGKVTGIVGPNGCGKSTLIKSILGLVVPDSGQISVCNHKVDSGGEHRKLIGYLPQTPDFPANLKISELFSMIQDVRKIKASRLEELIDLFAQAETLPRPLGVLSGGMKQKVATTLAFMFDPPVLVLDEPSVGLDPVAAVRLKSLLKSEAQRGKTIVLVSHVMSEAEQLLDNMAFLLDGQVKFTGEVETLRRRANASTLEDSLLFLMQSREAFERS